MATRTSKSGKVYNVPTVKSTYLAKNEKMLLAGMVASVLADLQKRQAELTLVELAQITELVALLNKLS